MFCFSEVGGCNIHLVIFFFQAKQTSKVNKEQAKRGKVGLSRLGAAGWWWTASELHQKEAEEGLGDDVKDGVDDDFTVNAEGASTFGNDPDDGVAEPGHGGEVSLHAAVVPEEEGVVKSGVNSAAAEPADVVDDGDEAKDGEGEEDPLVAVLNDGGDEASDDHEDVSEEQVDENVVGSAGEFAESVEHDGGSDYPVNVTSVEERAAIRAASVGTVAMVR